MDGSAPQPIIWRRRLILMLLAIVGLGVAGRAWMGGKPGRERKEASGPTPAVGTQIVPGEPPPAPPDTAQEEESPSWLKTLLPFLTEGGVSMLLGIALGIATRSVTRMLLFGFVLIFVVVQFAAYKGYMAAPDWGAFAAWVKDFVLNISAETDLAAIVQHKLPSAGAFILGFLIGLKRG